MMDGHVEIGVLQVYRCRPVPRTDKGGDIPRSVPAKPRRHHVSLVEEFEVDDGSPTSVLLRDDKHLGVVAERRRDFLDGALGQKGLHLLVDHSNMLRIRKSRIQRRRRYRKRRRARERDLVSQKNAKHG